MKEKFQIVKRSLPTHGASPYYSIAFGVRTVLSVRFSRGGYNLGWKIIHYRKTATYFSFGGFCVSMIYHPYVIE